MSRWIEELLAALGLSHNETFDNIILLHYLSHLLYHYVLTPQINHRSFLFLCHLLWQDVVNVLRVSSRANQGESEM